jgi:hypothetical protein
MNGAIMIRWGASIPGREAGGLDVFGKAIAHFEGLTKSGRVSGHHEYLSITGDAGGFMMVEGDLDELMKILAEEATLKLNNQASAIVSDFKIQAFAGGTDNAIQQLIGDYTASLQEIGLM